MAFQNLQMFRINELKYMISMIVILPQPQTYVTISSNTADVYKPHYYLVPRRRLYQLIQNAKFQ